MRLDTIPPLDLQTERLDRTQQPSNKMLLLVGAVALGGLFVSWTNNRDIVGRRNAAPAMQVAQATLADGIGPVIISRVILRHK